MYVNGTYRDNLESEPGVTVKQLVDAYARLQHVHAVRMAQKAVDELSDAEFDDLIFLMKEARDQNMRPQPASDCGRHLHRAINLVHDRNQGNSMRAFVGLYHKAARNVQRDFLAQEELV